jgi:hypothetical protein
MKFRIMNEFKPNLLKERPLKYNLKFALNCKTSSQRAKKNPKIQKAKKKSDLFLEAHTQNSSQPC